MSGVPKLVNQHAQTTIPIIVVCGQNTGIINIISIMLLEYYYAHYQYMVRDLNFFTCFLVLLTKIYIYIISD